MTDTSHTATHEKAFTETIAKDQRIEPRDWMPEGYRKTMITMPIQRRNFAASTKTPSSRSTTPTISRMIASPVMHSTLG